MVRFSPYIDRFKNPTVVAYHLSPNRFDRFEQQRSRHTHAHPDVGWHFGTKQTALTVGDKLMKEGRVSSGDLVYLYKVRLDLNDPLRLEENRSGSWSVFDILRAIFDPVEDGKPLPPQFDDDDLDAYWDDEVIAPSGENVLDLMHDKQAQIAEFIEWLRAHGVNAVVYDNRFEGGGESYIVFSPDQITVLGVEEYQIP
tara:strand:+ start:546 stop:1139 length:594 start_codon:yes stop_codon:yes gene_type:complete